MNVLITGGTGFVGHHLTEHILRNTDWFITILDRIDCASACDRLRGMDCWEKEQDRVRLIWHDLKSPVSDLVAHRLCEPDYIFHLAASSHVDRSISDPLLFAMDNTIGTANLLNYAREFLPDLKLFVNFSTDEVFGPAPTGVLHKEWDRFNPGNPYAAAKAGAEAMADAFANTYKMPIITTHTMNCFGERQHPEKFIPKIIRCVLRGEVLMIHADKTRTKAGSRFYIHARNVAAVLLWLLDKPGLDGSGERGKYNIVGERETDNLELAQMIAGFIGKPLKYDLLDFHSSRPGHDLRYALDGSLLSQMGWRYPKNFESSLETTVRWTLTHPEWLGA